MEEVSCSVLLADRDVLVQVLPWSDTTCNIGIKLSLSFVDTKPYLVPHNKH